MHIPGMGKGIPGPRQHPLTMRARRAPTPSSTGTGAARPGLRIYVGLSRSCTRTSRGARTAGLRPDGTWAIGSEEDVDLDGTPPSVAVLRAERAGGDTKTPRSRRALKLAQVAAGALRERQTDQAAERGAARSHWQDTGRVLTTATGTPRWVRVWPPRPQVRPMGSLRLWPDSSSKQSQAPRSAAVL